MVQLRGWQDPRRESLRTSRGAVWARTYSGVYELVPQMYVLVGVDAVGPEGTACPAEDVTASKQFHVDKRECRWSDLKDFGCPGVLEMADEHATHRI